MRTGLPSWHGSTPKSPKEADVSYQHLELEPMGPILRVYLNRPECLNALDTTTLQEIADCFTALQHRFEARVVILAGRGRSFSSGADRRRPPGRDLLDQAGISPRERRHHTQVGFRAVRAIEACEVVTVASVAGHAIGGGACLAFSCDFRIAAEDAVFHIPEVDLGVPLTWGATPRLIHEIGAARARQMILMAERVDGRRAETWGLVHRAVPQMELEAATLEWAKRVASKPALAVHMTKTQFRAYAARDRLGVVAETDGDLLAAASRDPAFREAFNWKPES